MASCETKSGTLIQQQLDPSNVRMMNSHQDSLLQNLSNHLKMNYQYRSTLLKKTFAIISFFQRFQTFRKKRTNFYNSHPILMGHTHNYVMRGLTDVPRKK